MMNFRSQRTPEPPALVHVVSRSDITWNRRVFKAPPLQFNPPRFDLRSFAQELRRDDPRNAR